MYSSITSTDIQQLGVLSDLGLCIRITFPANAPSQGRLLIPTVAGNISCAYWTTTAIILARASPTSLVNIAALCLFTRDALLSVPSETERLLEAIAERLQLRWVEASPALPTMLQAQGIAPSSDTKAALALSDGWADVLERAKGLLAETAKKRVDPTTDLFQIVHALTKTAPWTEKCTFPAQVWVMASIVNSITPTSASLYEEQDVLAGIKAELVSGRASKSLKGMVLALSCAPSGGLHMLPITRGRHEGATGHKIHLTRSAEQKMMTQHQLSSTSTLKLNFAACAHQVAWVLSPAHALLFLFLQSALRQDVNALMLEALDGRPEAHLQDLDEMQAEDILLKVVYKVAGVANVLHLYSFDTFEKCRELYRRPHEYWWNRTVQSHELRTRAELDSVLGAPQMNSQLRFIYQVTKLASTAYQVDLARGRALWDLLYTTVALTQLRKTLFLAVEHDAEMVCFMTTTDTNKMMLHIAGEAPHRMFRAASSSRVELHPMLALSRVIVFCVDYSDVNTRWDALLKAPSSLLGCQHLSVVLTGFSAKPTTADQVQQFFTALEAVFTGLDKVMKTYAADTRPSIVVLVYIPCTDIQKADMSQCLAALGAAGVDPHFDQKEDPLAGANPRTLGRRDKYKLQWQAVTRVQHGDVYALDLR
jgi:hypothetical protein